MGTEAARRVSVRVPGFLPSTGGFRFCNFFPPGPILRMRLPGLRWLRVGDASRGVCGGMVFGAIDYFLAGKAPPGSEETPPLDSPLFRHLVWRLFDSFCLPTGPLRYWTWMAAPDHDGRLGRGILRRTLHEEWPKVKKELDRGRLAPIGFIRHRSRNPLRLGENHQVLAYGYDLDAASGEVRMSVYDPNYALDNGLTMTFNPRAASGRGGIVYSLGQQVRGFFHTPYRPSWFPWCRRLP